jgi:hypothetical protein
VAAEESPNVRRLAASLAEFQALRAEIVQRLQSQQALYALCILANAALLGAALAGTKSHPKVLFCIPFVASAVGLAYADQTRRIFHIGIYIRDTLWPRVDQAVDGVGHSWEETFSDVMTIRTPFQAMLSTVYIGLLFVFTPLVANFYSAFAQHWDFTFAEWLLWGAGLAAVAFYAAVGAAVALRYGLADGRQEVQIPSS